MKNKMTNKEVSTMVAGAMKSPYEDKYRAEDGLRTLVRAEEIKRDKPLMKEVKQLAKKQAADLKKVC